MMKPKWMTQFGQNEWSQAKGNDGRNLWDSIIQTRKTKRADTHNTHPPAINA